MKEETKTKPCGVCGKKTLFYSMAYVHNILQCVNCITGKIKRRKT